MTDETVTPAPDDGPAKWDPASDPDGYTWEDVRSKDFLLDVVLDFALGEREEPGGSFTLTITTGGQVVSGTAISRSEWMDAVASQYEGAGGTEHLRQVFEKLQERILEEMDRRKAADLPEGARGFVHMRDVRIGNGNVWTQVPYWRGALADVSGWSLGSWQQSPSDE